MREHLVAIFEGAHDVDPWGGFRKPGKQRLQPFAALMGLGIVLDVLVLVDHRDGGRVTGFDAFQQRANFCFSILSHGHHQIIRVC
jgi:hypothetical protein